ncbi:fungal-specific transcription factor domain-containing protein [Desarmillaria tabescens]|uniref:Fungal-specific transcription factor domain-containing protein n=1 Tax=Armillaria tabescens TaxID=1929756 RepID=A0AA39TT27_ARMTA|nr:fungal-specific transcription factor domain-containing protein [Desarmillaria tabescens]KAK0469332.1 fungal-specific transcription factor domain-containing protein [Desarmillaria tabescens]
MSIFSVQDSSYFINDNPEHPDSTVHSQVPVKTESSPSPDLLPASASLQNIRFSFRSQPSSSHGSSHSSSRQPSEAPPLVPQSVYRFSQDTSSDYGLMSSVNSWSPQHEDSQMDGHIGLQNAMSFSDEYDEVGDLIELPSMAGSSGGLTHLSGVTGEKPIRRRSSKACDQCRKSKCKCERTSPEEPCRSCVMLGTPCTFLGPSRKRGPPKGYIDAIEARLHQTEALLGIMISSADPRAQTLLQDIAQDSLAREIINRVDNSPYGVKGRKGGDGEKTAGPSKSRHLTAELASQKAEDSKPELTSTHPSNEWQDRVTHMLDLLRRDTAARSTVSGPSDTPLPSLNHQQTSQSRSARDLPSLITSIPLSRSTSYQHPEHESASASDGSHSPGRRLRRKVDSGDVPYPSSAPPSALSPIRSNSAFDFRSSVSPGRAGKSAGVIRRSVSDIVNRTVPTRSASPASFSSESDEDDLLGAVGQLSLNEDEEVRYHGKASGLYLLGGTERHDNRNEGGIWRFPKARVWPALPTSIPVQEKSSTDLPSPALQDHLLNLYFTYVHPSLPVIHKRSFQEAYKAGPDTPLSESGARSPSGSPFNRRSRHVPNLLLLVMFSLATRYVDDPSNPMPSPDSGVMWAAGDQYLDRAKVLLDGSYSSSRPTTCQALLLMGYREIGIGAMAQAWTYIGMAIRMAQDLGMQRSADGWARRELGGKLFSEAELQTRRRIWYSCVVMDKYVSSYIGRPLAIFERDFDTQLPGELDAEELEDWKPRTPLMQDTREKSGRPSYIISCFNASATLSGIISMIVQAIYAVRPVSSRHAESVYLESMLDKWYLELPAHLQHDPVSLKHPVPLPHVLTLHMQYWCAVLLLHRPFIRHVIRSPNPNEEDGRTASQKSYELCVGAANHITAIATLYKETYSLRGCPVFLCYYVFTASIMHVTSASVSPGDPQARLRLSKCMEVLKAMAVLWPSAGRAHELLRGAEVNFGHQIRSAEPLKPVDRYKRPAEGSLDDRSVGMQTYTNMRPSNNYTASNLHPPQAFPANGTTDVQYTQSSSYYSNYDRPWASEHSSQHVPYPGPLSTSALPQVYSTGLADGRPSLNRTVSHGMEHHPRYPQYWNDYSTYSPLDHGVEYPQTGAVHEPQNPLTHLFMPEQYNVYNNTTSSNPQ